MKKTITGKIDSNNLPEHVAIIMDGNGRWAKKRFLPRIAGHHEGVKRVEPIVTTAAKMGIKALTLYSFSAENWSRPEKEVSALMKLLDGFMLDKHISDLFYDNEIKFNIIGKIERIPEYVRTKLLQRIEDTKKHTGMVLTLALSYGSQDEIIECVKHIVQKVKEGKLEPSAIDAETIDENLMTAGLPKLDLIIRTSGEFRVSNFLLWQAAYSEFYFTEKLWPEFDENEFIKAIIDFQGRQRRFGKTDEQINAS
ncbi:MAG: isoprenyl transferase [Nitrospinae bacterium]|nr:isoprenyl transferase [Nitrospinota bacterium]